MKSPKIELLSRFLKKQARSRQNKNPILPYIKQQSADEAAKTAGNLKKGHEFEAFIVRLFNPDFFRLLEWRSDKIIDGVSPFMNRFPDLEFYYQSQREDLHFAVECKWKQNFYEDCIELPEFQLNNYRQYQKLTGIPTFIVIGIGNTPARPNAVYVVPLKEITFGKLHEFVLFPFKREVVDHNFFLNCSEQTLK